MQNVKMLSVALGLLILTTFSGCSWIPGCNTIKYVDREVEVYIDVPCRVPDVNCTVSGTDGEVIGDLLECIVDHKRAGEVCKDREASIKLGER